MDRKILVAKVPVALQFCISVLITSIGIAIPAWAQIAADGTLSTHVSQAGNDFTITNGNQASTNLFHSFSQFSVPTGGSVFFNNTVTIQNIFARVTGGSVSSIDGLIRANGTANLFLLNPRGILFGPNASLNIGGSFIASTASSVIFADGATFNTTDTTVAPLLTLNVPVGLQMGNNPAPITVQGTGFNLNASSSGNPIVQKPSASELRVQPEKTLALVGGNLTLNGATLMAPQGRIELGSLSGAGLVSLNAIPQGYQLAYEGGQRFGSIQLAQKSLLSVSGVNAGSLQLQGGHIQFSEGSLVLSKNLGSLPGGELLLQASEGIDISGTTTDASIRSGIRSEALNSGNSSAIRIITPRLIMSQGAGVNTNTFRSASSGDIEINATTVEVSGSSTINPTGVTSLTTSSRSTKPAGNLSIIGNSLLVSGGASISSVAFGAGSTGQVSIQNTSTTVTGDNFGGLYSNISATTFGTGNAQNVTLDTARLQLINGGVVSTTSWLAGQAGNLNINATESIVISGRGQSNNSSINSAVIHPEPLIQKLFGLPNILTANSGNITVSTPKLTLTDGGSVNVTNYGSGNGGSIKIAADTLSLDHQSNIQAQTESGNGGNITVQAGNLSLLRYNSLISATSGGAGNGGNITLNSPLIVGWENSDIVANALKGRGGNIQISTEGIFGLKLRPQLTPENDITASSQFGVNGTIQINTLSLDPNSGLVELPANVVDPSQQITTSCSGTQENRFVAIGHGGVPQNPTQQVRSDRTWSDLRDLAAHQKPNTAVVTQAPMATPGLIQAGAWHRNDDGTITLVPSQVPAALPSFATCSGAAITSTYKD